MSGVASFVLTARLSVQPDNYDWNATRPIALSDSDVPSEGKIGSSSASTSDVEDEKKDQPTATVATAELDSQKPGVVAPAFEEAAKDPALDRAVLQRVCIRSLWISGIFALFIAIERFSIIWVLLAGGFCVILPIFESRKGIFILARSALRVMAGRRVKGDVVA
ncbi:sodium/solute symporter [Rhodotorula toruloides]|uniref:Sodium/solute symporter n=1 Tax=Rhodotorula toruloides TaxID=5286 RepID=A0A511KRU3_RHOTO|nr:sodium/solute symporter [Rhodotorula toruloides]